MNFDPDTSAGARNRAIGYVVLGVAAVGVVLALLIGGLGTVARQAAVPRATTGGGASPSSTPTTARTGNPSPTSTATSKPTPRHGGHRSGAPTLAASPRSVATYERIYLTGRFPRLGGGAALQVQRKVGSVWSDFPVTMTTQTDGSFSTYVETGRTGANPFRVVSADGSRTPAVTVQVG
ncbi:MAG: hypothetical protein ACR2KL_02940 [Nocardioidaceae bacterium]